MNKALNKNCSIKMEMKIKMKEKNIFPHSIPLQHDKENHQYHVYNVVKVK